MDNALNSLQDRLEGEARHSPRQFIKSLEKLGPTALPWSPALEKACLLFILQGEKSVQTREAQALFRAISHKWGVQRSYNLILRAEIIAGLRPRPETAIFDHTLHLIGGGQKYGCTVAHVLQDTCNVTLLSNRPVTRESLEDWYNLDLSGCTVKTISIPFFESGAFHQIDPGVITVRDENPFHPVSIESGRYDVFINNSMLEMVYPLANVSVFICHFPERRKSSYFYVDRYQNLIYNSNYTAEWIRRKWAVSPTAHIYPPADMEWETGLAAKENLILSVARFEPGGTKQQDRMVEIFSRLHALYPEVMAGWNLVLVGGSPEENPYLEKVKNQLTANPTLPVELKVNICAEELRRIYLRAKIFWHLCGLHQTDPARVEHFGMTIVEAMQNGCVPVVFNGGGQREIVEHGNSGFLFSTSRELINHTLALIKNPAQMAKMGGSALQRSRIFSRRTFESRVREYFARIIREYSTLE